MKLPSHLFKSYDGNLYDTRDSNWSRNAPLRKEYSRGFREIDTAAQFKAVLRHGAHTDLGGYPLFLICDDGAALCFDCGRKELRNILPTYREKTRDGWRVVGCDVNYEENDLTCGNCSKAIPSAYGED